MQFVSVKHGWGGTPAMRQGWAPLFAVRSVLRPHHWPEVDSLVNRTQILNGLPHTHRSLSITAGERLLE